MRKANDGVALAAIVAKETNHSTWSGTGGGIGVGADGLGLFAGIASGNKWEQSQRAKNFQAPPKAAYNSLYVWGPVLGLLGVAAIVRISSGAIDVLSEGEPVPVGNMQTLHEMASVMGLIVPVLLVAGVLWWFLIGSNRRAHKEAARFAAAEALDRIKADVYNRLRYVEKDHIVFDPKSGREVAAERADILQLLHDIAQREQTGQTR